MEKAGENILAAEHDPELLILDAILTEVKNSDINKKGENVGSNSPCTDLNSLGDDEVEGFLKRKFNEYSTNVCLTMNQDLKVNESTEIIATAVPVVGTSEPLKRDVSVYTDPVFGLRIIHPQISSGLLVERMAGRKRIGFNELSKYIIGKDVTGDWCIAGVLLSKSQHTAKNGDLYSIWRLSDLRGEILTISLFLFHNAHKEFWKTSQGTCVALLNPKCLEKKGNNGDIGKFAIDSAKKIMILGRSNDLGTCKARKKNGEQCNATVNLNIADFCIAHMEMQFKKSVRASFSLPKNRSELCRKPRGCGGQYFWSARLNNSAKLMQKDTKILTLLTSTENSSSEKNVSINPNNVKDVPYASRTGPNCTVAAAVESETKQRVRDSERLKALRSSISTSNKLSTPTGNSLEYFGHQRTAKEKVIGLLKICPIEKIDPNSIRGTKEGKRRAIDELNEKFLSVKRQKLEDKSKSHMADIMAANSSHTNLIDIRHLQQEDKYFHNLERREALEEKMLNTYKKPCKAVICHNCKYTAFSAAERCKDENHKLKIIDAVKRFFQCKDCGHRTATVFKLPKLSCAHCNGSRWERSAMIRDRNNFEASEGLSIRGDEETFLGGICKINMNLLSSNNE